MLFDPACIPCVVKQAHNLSAKFANCTKEVQFKILNEVCEEVKTVNGYSSAQLLSGKIQSIVEKNLGSENPYEKIKYNSYKTVEQYKLYLQTLIDDSTDRLEMAVRTAITGNTIDIAANPDYDIQYDINHITSSKIQMPVLEEFRSGLKKANSILYIADNFEEAFFDKFLLNEFPAEKTVFAVRSRPILNDITFNDALNIGIDQICRVIESGSTIAGTNMKEATGEFLELFKNSNIVIAKGQGNYETLFMNERPIYFMFKVKCSVIAEKCGYPEGSGLLITNKFTRE